MVAALSSTTVQYCSSSSTTGAVYREVRVITLTLVAVAGAGGGASFDLDHRLLLLLLMLRCGRAILHVSSEDLTVSASR